MANRRHSTDVKETTHVKKKRVSGYVTEKQASGKVKVIYEELKKKKGKIPQIYMALARDPDFLEAYYNKRNTVMRPGKIDLKTKEIIAFAVSVVHNCRH